MNVQFIFLFLIPLITFSVIKPIAIEANADETRLKVIFNTRNSKKKGDIITGGLYVDNEKWLQFDENSALFANNKWNSQTAGSIVLIDTIDNIEGNDQYGKYSCIKKIWSLDTKLPSFSTEVCSYPSEEVAIFKTTILSNDLKGTNGTNPKFPIINFPSIYLDESGKHDNGMIENLGYAYFHGLWQGPVVKQNLQTLPRLPQRHEGPIIFTDKNGKTVLLGPLNDPLNTVFQISSNNGNNKKVFSYGPSQMIESLPINYTYSVAAVLAPINGATNTIQRYGKMLLGHQASTMEDVAKTMKQSRVKDPFVEKISAWTDNGAYFFYNNLGQKNLPPAQIALPSWINSFNDNAEINVPMQSLQLDGWWMNQTTSAPSNKFFPDWDGFRKSFSGGANSVNLLMYKAFFTESYDLFEKYDKVQSPKGVYYPSAEDAYKFYSEVFDGFISFGAKAFETDFMSDHLLPTPGLARNVNGLPLYHGGLAKAALEHSLPVQFCMPTVCQVIATANYPAITNVRVSTDYATETIPGNTGQDGWVENYVIGLPSLITWAVGVSPSKDIVVTTQLKKPIGGMTKIYKNCEMDFLLAVLSTGPVGLGDAPNYTNITLVKTGIRRDGTLLKPSKPLTGVDSTFIPSNRAHGEIGFLPVTKDGDCSNNTKTSCSPSLDQTHTSIPLFNDYASAIIDHGKYVNGIDNSSNNRIKKSLVATWHMLLSMHLGSYVPPVSDFYPSVSPSSLSLNNLGSFKEWRWSKCKNGEHIAKTNCIVTLTNGEIPDVSSGPNRADANGSDAYRLFHFYPNLPVIPSAKVHDGSTKKINQESWILLGEINKIVPVSEFRFKNIGVKNVLKLKMENATSSSTSSASSCLEWSMVGSANEIVNIGAFTPAGVYLEQSFVIQKSGEEGETFKFCE